MTVNRVAPGEQIFRKPYPRYGLQQQPWSPELHRYCDGDIDFSFKRLLVFYLV